MVKDGRTDLHYGILVRNIPNECDTLIARVIDVGGNTVTSAPIPVPNQVAKQARGRELAPFQLEAIARAKADAAARRNDPPSEGESHGS